MKLVIKKKFIQIFILVTLIIIGSFLLFNKLYKKSNTFCNQEQNAKSNNLYVLNFYNNIRNKSKDIENLIEDRYFCVSAENIVVGRNKKEIGNGYFDFKIFIENTKPIFYINKLFKEVNKEIYVDQNYTKEIVKLVDFIFGLKLKSDSIDKITNIIIEQYKSIRSNYSDNYNEYCYRTSINDEISFTFIIRDNMLGVILE